MTHKERHKQAWFRIQVHAGAQPDALLLERLVSVGCAKDQAVSGLTVPGHGYQSVVRGCQAIPNTLLLSAAKNHPFSLRTCSKAACQCHTLRFDRRRPPSGDLVWALPGNAPMTAQTLPWHQPAWRCTLIIGIEAPRLVKGAHP